MDPEKEQQQIPVYAVECWNKTTNAPMVLNYYLSETDAQEAKFGWTATHPDNPALIHRTWVPASTRVVMPRQAE